MCKTKLFRNVPCLWWFCGPETLPLNIQWNAAQPVWALENGGGVEDLWQPLTHRKADLVLNVFKQQSIHKINVTNLNNVMCQDHTKLKQNSRKQKSFNKKKWFMQQMESSCLAKITSKRHLPRSLHYKVSPETTYEWSYDSNYRGENKTLLTNQGGYIYI